MLFISLYVSTTVEKYDDLNTEEHQATVARIETDSKECKIYTYQYNCVLSIQLEEIIYDNYLVELYNGANITFRIPEFYDYRLQDERIESLVIVSLKTDNAAIVTLESHNKMLEKEYYKLKIIGLVFTVLFLLGAIICFGLIIKNKTKKISQ